LIKHKLICIHFLQTQYYTPKTLQARNTLAKLWQFDTRCWSNIDWLLHTSTNALLRINNIVSKNLIGQALKCANPFLVEQGKYFPPMGNSTATSQQYRQKERSKWTSIDDF
jgi:hypothetical protein